MEARSKGCCLLLPQDVLVNSPAGSRICDLEKIKRGEVVSDVGPATVKRWGQEVCQAKTVVWNGPLGVFEVHPFHTGTLKLAKVVAERTQKNGLCSVAGGGDTLAALQQTELFLRFTYVSSAGGAFLEWLEGRSLPGLHALEKSCVIHGKKVNSRGSGVPGNAGRLMAGLAITH